MTRPPKGSSLVPPHLNDAQILAFLDGELPAEEMSDVRAHLESCWSCRSWTGVMQARIDNFLRARKDLLPGPVAFEESRVEQFRQRLHRHAASSEKTVTPAWRDRIGAWFDPLRDAMSTTAAFLMQHQKAAMASTLAICLVLVMFTDVLNTRVSADTVLARSENYERTFAVGGSQVTRSSVQVESIDRRSGSSHRLGTLTVVRDSVDPVTYVRSQNAAGAVSTDVIKDNHPAEVLSQVLGADVQEKSLAEYLARQNWVPDVSASGFHRLVAPRQMSDSAAQRDGQVFQLRYPFAAGHPSGIAEADFRVDARTYAPESISIVTAGDSQREYRFTRTSFSTESREIELAKMSVPSFSGDSARVSGSVSTQPMALRKIVPLNYASSQATEEEVTAAEALHHADACLGEEVYLFPMSDGSLLVQGLVETSARRDAIRQALKEVSGLRIEVYLPREIRTGFELYNAPDQSTDRVRGGVPTSSATLADLSSAKMPLYERLYQHFSQSGSDSDAAEKQVAVFSNELVTLARQTFLHAWALKKLDREFSGERIANLPPAVQQKVEQMRQDHRRWVSTLAQRQSEMLSEVAGHEIAQAAGAVADGQQDSSELLRLAQEQNDLVRALFTTSQASSETTASLARLLVVLRRMGA